MKSEFLKITFAYQQTSLQTQIEYENNCPHCDLLIQPHFVYASTYDDRLKQTFAVLFQCPFCKKYFVYEYSVNHDSIKAGVQFIQTTYIPHIYKKNAKYDLPEELAAISPSFKNIYLQSLTAEADGLGQLTGIGFRKSIEFLIKDFLIFHQNEDSEKITKLPLGQAIKLLQFEKIKHLAMASVWLGNDETHYVRKYEDKEVCDMKKFIRALAFYISSELVAKEAEEFVTG